jgi:receptor protein-tyrosine kinase
MDSIERAAKRIAEQKPPEKRTGFPAPMPSQNGDSRPSPTAGERPPPGPRSEPLSRPPPLPLKGKLVEIDAARLGKLGFISPLQPVTRVAEEFRVLKHRVLFNVFNADAQGEASPRLIMVTSSQPQEGKTFTAVNLALSIATERDTHALLIDGDFLHPSVFKSLHLQRPQHGFLDLLADNGRGIESIVCRSSIDHLSLIDAGRGNALASEYLSSQRMRQICQELVSRYDNRVIIFDTSPLLATSEPSILSHHVGQVLYVVEAGRTSRTSVQAGLDLIHDQSKVSMILNRNKSVAGSQSFGGYHDYYRSKSS